MKYSMFSKMMVLGMALVASQLAFAKLGDGGTGTGMGSGGDELEGYIYARALAIRDRIFSLQVDRPYGVMDRDALKKLVEEKLGVKAVEHNLYDEETHERRPMVNYTDAEGNFWILVQRPNFNAANVDAVDGNIFHELCRYLKVPDRNRRYSARYTKSLHVPIPQGGVNQWLTTAYENNDEMAMISALDAGADPEARVRDREDREELIVPLVGWKTGPERQRLTQLLLDNGADPVRTRLFYWTVFYRDYAFATRLLASRPELFTNMELGHVKSFFGTPLFGPAKVLGPEAREFRSVLMPYILRSQVFKDQLLLRTLSVFRQNFGYDVTQDDFLFVGQLLAEGANPNVFDLEDTTRKYGGGGVTALRRAAASPHASRLLDLLQNSRVKVDPDTRDEKGHNVLDGSPFPDFIYIHERWPDLRPTTPVSLSVMTESYERLGNHPLYVSGYRALLEMGADPNEVGRYGHLIFSMFVTYSVYGARDYPPQKVFDVLKLMLAHGLNVHARNGSRETLLEEIASEAGRLKISDPMLHFYKEVARILIAHGAQSVNAGNGRSALAIFRSRRDQRLDYDRRYGARRSPERKRLTNRCKVHSIETVLAPTRDEAERLAHTEWEPCSLR